jgi:iron complex transport system permease protein
LAGILVVVAMAALLLGAARIAPGRLFASLLHPGSADPADRILLELRLPRVVLGALAGAALALSGTLLQAFFQNPMAGPYVVGVSSGAGLTAVAAMTLGLTFRRGPFDVVAVAAFVGGIGSVTLVHALARRIRFLQSEGLLLIGIAVGSVFSALTSVFLVFSREGIQAALMWMLGTFSMAEWSKVWAPRGAGRGWRRIVLARARPEPPPLGG